MPSKKQIDHKTIRKNPAVDLDLVNEAERHVERLKDLGVEFKRGYRIAHPLDGQIVRGVPQVSEARQKDLFVRSAPLR